MATLKLNTLKCFEQEDWTGSDEIEMLVYTDEATRPESIGRWSFKEGHEEPIASRIIQFTHQVIVEIREKDVAFDDLLGSHTIYAREKKEGFGRFHRAGVHANYLLTYEVSETDLVEAAPGSGHSDPANDANQSFASAPVNRAAEVTCGGDKLTWVKLRYLHYFHLANGRPSPVPGAGFVITDDAGVVLRQGKLDANGFTEQKDLPARCTSLRYWFDDDPEEYRIFEQWKPQPIEKYYRDRDESFLDRVADAFKSLGDWTWGVFLGDFNDEPSMSQIVARTVISCIPVVDQVLDVQDICAAMYWLAWKKQYDRWDRWAGLILSLVGCVPEVGSVVKGVLKAILNKLPLDGLVQLIRRLNWSGVGNAVKWIERLAKELLPGGKYYKHVGDLLRKILASLRNKLRRVCELVPARIERAIRDTLHTLGEVEARIDDMRKNVLGWFKEQLDRLIEHFHLRKREHFGSTQTENVHKQEAEPWKKERTSEDPSEPRPMRKVKPPNARGMLDADDRLLGHYAKENGLVIIVRDSNLNATQWARKAREQHEPYLPKPENLKAKSLKEGNNAGLVSAKRSNVEEMLKEMEDLKPPKGTGVKPMSYEHLEEYLNSKGYWIDKSTPDYLVRKKHGDVPDPKTDEWFYSDYDLHGVYREANGADAYSKRVMNDLNRDFGEKMVQHGPHDEWPERNTPGPNKGPKPECTAYMPDGTKVALKDISDMKAFYHKLGTKPPWEQLYPGY